MSRYRNGLICGLLLAAAALAHEQSGVRVTAVKWDPVALGLPVPPATGGFQIWVRTSRPETELIRVAVTYRTGGAARTEVKYREPFAGSDTGFLFTTAQDVEVLAVLVEELTTVARTDVQ